MDRTVAFRAQFPVFERLEYLNAGTTGPLAERAAHAARERIENVVLKRGRSGPAHFDELLRIREEVRAAYAAVMGCASNEVALTYSTSDGLNIVLHGWDFQPGDEIVTSDEEHPGLLGPLGLLREDRGVKLTIVPFDDVPHAVGPQTKMIACSHVSFMSGNVMDIPALAQHGIPVLIDGAQALGAIPVDVRALGCDFYAGSGQKWLCGPDATGCLYVREDRVEQIRLSSAHYLSFDDPYATPALSFRQDASRFDVGTGSGELFVWALETLRMLDSTGWPWIHTRGPELAQHLATRLAGEGFKVAPRGPSTLVSFFDAAATERVPELRDAGFEIRDIPADSLLRVSVGAWNTEEKLEEFVQHVLRQRP